MSDYDDDLDREVRKPRQPGEGVRIIGAEEAAAAIEEGKVAGRRPDDAPRFGDVPARPQTPTSGFRFPLPESVDPADVADVAARRTVSPAATGSSPEMQHWTEPPTGEVPKVLASEDAQGDDLGAWSGFASRAPRWRDSGADWEDADFDDVSALSDDETRVGALDVNRTAHSDLFSFDEPEPLDGEPEAHGGPAPEPAPTRTATRIRSQSPPPDNGYGGPPKSGGRDIGVAVGVGVGIALLALLCFKLGRPTTLAFATIVVTAAAAEAFAVLRRAGYRPATLLGLAGTVSMMLAVYRKGTGAYPVVLALFIVFSFLWYLARVERARPTINIAASTFAFVWVAGLGSFASLMLTLPGRNGIAALLGAVLCTVAYDVGGLFFGSQMGTRPLLPAISPNKTWEGLLGGAASAVVIGAITGVVLHPWGGFIHGVLLGAVVATVAPIGDLCESMVKRDIGVKDMGSILPGHGGVLDRFDALLFVLPAVYYLSLFFHFNRF